MLASAEALSGPTSPPVKRVQVHNPAGSEVGPGTIATQGKATADWADAFGFKWDLPGRSSKHMRFDRSGPDTSNIAEGQWFPAFVSQPEKRTGLFNQQFQAASEFAYRRYQIMVGLQYGVRWMRNYFLGTQPWNEQTYFGKES